MWKFNKGKIMINLTHIKPMMGYKQPSIIPVKKGIYQLEKGVTYWFHAKTLDGYTRTYTVSIPTGFYSDGQSSPRFLWWYMRPDGLVRIAALIHDALYRSRGGLEIPIKGGMNDGVVVKVKIGSRYVNFSRKSCDMVYRAFYVAYVGNKRKARMGYIALRIFGGRHFGEPMPVLREGK